MFQISREDEEYSKVSISKICLNENIEWHNVIEWVVADDKTNGGVTMCLGNGWSQTFRLCLDIRNNEENERKNIKFLKKLAFSLDLL
jgi:hypothetical protein